MNSPKVYYSVGRAATDPPRTAELRIKRSIFTCHLAYAGTMAEAKAFITKISRENKTATHNCWAYIVGDQGETSHASDAGEPAGTAGKPMLNALASRDITCTAAVVTRVFGGVKLGIRGLIEAYGMSVAAALDLAPLVRLVKTVQFRVRVPYPFNDIFLNQIQPFKAQILNSEYGAEVVHHLEVEADDAGAVEGMLTEYQNQGRLGFEPLE